MEKNGYFLYTIQTGDTIYKLSNEFETSVQRIITANSGINIYNLNVGENIIIPVGNVVDTNEYYDSQKMYDNIDSLRIIYPFIQVEEIGKSEREKPIKCIKIGTGNKEVFYNASFHANELITTNVLMKFIEDYARAFTDNTTIYGLNAKNLYYSASLYIVPMVNPDGVDLVTGSIPIVDNAYINAQKIAESFPNIPFPQGWKANITGVDLNLQFPAGWEQAKQIKNAQGFNKPAPRDFVGYGPLTAKEALAIYNFTLRHNFRLVIAYHTQGKVIYWQFLDYNPPMAEEIGRRFANISGYTLAEVPYESSFARI
ncbi:MAG: LysM peptidoglycan-binding domain-containing protein [Clostridia bacterium]|nr:LysM peptidoglycan-binding domain-containing protein [Clostridia bacterium]